MIIITKLYCKIDYYLDLDIFYKYNKPQEINLILYIYVVYLNYRIMVFNVNCLLTK